MRDELEYEEIYELLSTPAEAIPGQVGRRRFLQGALAAGAATTMLPGWLDQVAAAATPVKATEGILVVVQLGGGNDGMSMISPTSGHRDSARYRSFRGNLAVSGALTLADGLGLHPRLPKLKARYDAGKVAVVRGVGQTAYDLSHFTSMATWMAGTSGTSRSTGWLGRWLDGIPESAAGLRGVQVGSGIPLHLRGARSVVTAIDSSGSVYGSNRKEAYLPPVYNAIKAMGAGTTGRGRLADLVADTGASAMDLATTVAPVFGSALPTGSPIADLTIAARLINADLGIRVLSVPHGSYDHHDGMSWSYPDMMTRLDDAIEAFFTTLGSQWRDQVTLMTFSEFGRTVKANGSGGTDHGTASPQLVIGDGVKGGLYGGQPKLDDLTSRGDLKVQVDFRSYYASIIDGWMAGGSATVLGGSYEDLKLFRTTPGGPVTTPPPPTTPTPWRPFPTAEALVRQQYVDLLGRPADDTGAAYWTGLLTSGQRSISWLVNAFLNSPEFGAVVGPAARLALVALDAPPPFSSLMTWSTRVRRGDALLDVAKGVCTSPQFVTRFGRADDATFLDGLHRGVFGSAPPAAFRNEWLPKLSAGTAQRAEVVLALATRPDGIAALKPSVDVVMTYAGLLRRQAEAGGFTYWVTQVERGASIQRLVQQFFASAEYRARFA